MAQEYLPAPSNVRLADLMKEHNISQPELAKELGCSKSTINRFISGAKGTLTHEQVLKIARLFNVSTDFLLGETNIPDRKNYDIVELGLSVEAAKNLYTGRVNTEVVNLLLENARFAELTYRIAQYFDDTFASGIAAQNAMFTTLSTLLRTKVKTPEAAKAAKDISLRRKPVYQGDLDDIEMYFMAAVKEIKKGIGSHYAEQEAMSKKVAEKMFTELTKGQDVRHPTITAEQLTDAMLNSCGAGCWESCSLPQSRKTPMKQTNERLCALAQKGDAAALDSLIDNNKSFIGKVANDLFRSMNLAQSGLNLNTDDLKQAGNLGLWKAVPKFDAVRGMKFLTYAAPAIRNAMMDMVRDAFAAFEQRMVTEDKDGICYQRVSLDDVLPGEEQLRRIEAIADPYAMQPQSIMEEQESRRELYDGLKRLTQREQTYLLYRYGFTDGEEHPLIGTAIYFHLTKGRAKKTEEQAMDNLWLELPWWFI